MRARERLGKATARSLRTRPRTASAPRHAKSARPRTTTKHDDISWMLHAGTNAHAARAQPPRRREPVALCGPVHRHRLTSAESERLKPARGYRRTETTTEASPLFEPCSISRSTGDPRDGDNYRLPWRPRDRDDCVACAGAVATGRRGRAAVRACVTVCVCVCVCVCVVCICVHNINTQRPIADVFFKHRPAGGSAITVTCGETGRGLDTHIYLLYHVNDIRGVAPLCCGSHPPCHVGSCVRCQVKGLTRLNRTILPSAVTALAPGDPLRGAYEKEFAADPDLSGLATLGRPRTRTRRGAIASGNRCETGAGTEHNEAFKRVSVFMQVLPYFDVTKHTVYDLAHTIANVVKLLFAIICNKKDSSSARYTPNVRREETEIRGRFEYQRRYKLL